MSKFDECINEQGPIISTIIFGVLFLVSEALPYITSLEGNGIVEEIAKLLRGKIPRTEHAPRVPVDASDNV